MYANLMCWSYNKKLLNVNEVRVCAVFIVLFVSFIKQWKINYATIK